MEHLRYVLLLSLFSTFLQAQFQPCAPPHKGEWIVDSAMFPADIVKLRAWTDADSNGTYVAYEFTEGGSVRISMHTLPNRGVCGNGMTVLNKGTWSSANQVLRIALSGIYVAAGKFDYDLEYSMTCPSKDKLKLKKTRTYKNEY